MKQKSQHYATLAIGPDSLGKERRSRFYRVAKEENLSFSAFAIRVIEDYIKEKESKVPVGAPKQEGVPVQAEPGV